MVTKRNLMPARPRPLKFQNLSKSAGILDDHAIRKNVATREGTIEKVPVNDNDITNKKYVDDTHTPAGNNGEVQFNDNGSFGASSNLTWDGTYLNVEEGFKIYAGGVLKGTFSYATFPPGMNFSSTTDLIFSTNNDLNLWGGTDGTGDVNILAASGSGTIKLDGTINANTHKINNVVDPTANQDAATKYSTEHFLDSVKKHYGTGNDYSIQFDGSDAVHTITAGDFVFTGGNVGIGTASPNQITQIYHATAPVLSLTAGGSNPTIGGAVDLLEYDGSGAGFGGANAYGFRVTYDGSDDYFKIKSGNGATVTDRFVIKRDTGNVGVGTTAPEAKLDISNGAIGLLIGADPNVDTRTDATQKYGRMGIPHYLNAEQPMAVFLAGSNASTNGLYIGGGSSYFNAATTIAFYTASDTTTTTGTTNSNISETGLNLKDNFPLQLGTGKDASITHDGTNLLINPQVVGSGKTVFTGSAIIPTLYGDTNTGSYLTIAGQTDLMSRGNARIGADEDGSGAGALSLRTKGAERITIDNNGNVIIANIPTSDPSIAGALWSDGGTIKISSG